MLATSCAESPSSFREVSLDEARRMIADGGSKPGSAGEHAG